MSSPHLSIVLYRNTILWVVVYRFSLLLLRAVPLESCCLAWLVDFLRRSMCLSEPVSVISKGRWDLASCLHRVLLDLFVLPFLG